MNTSTPTLARHGRLQLNGITKTFGTATAVDDLSLNVRDAEFVSLLGPSGCGKTTLLRIIAGFEQPSAGEVVLDGSAITGVPAHRRPINTVFQSYALFPHMNVASNVAYGLKQSRVPRREINQRVREALSMVQMMDFAERKPSMLSGGQQQRIALARALVNRPQVLLLDEPMSALDRKLREEMQIELKLLQRQLGTTFVFVTHDQDEALTMSDRIVVMSDGRIQQIGTAENVYTSPANAFVAGFIGKQNFLPAVISDRRAEELRLESAVGTLHARSSPGSPSTGTQVTAAIRPEAIELYPADDAGASPNRLQGRIGAVFFLGDAVAHAVILPDGTELLCHAPRGRAPMLSTGQEAVCRFATADVQVFAA